MPTPAVRWATDRPPVRPRWSAATYSYARPEGQKQTDWVDDERPNDHRSRERIPGMSLLVRPSRRGRVPVRGGVIWVDSARDCSTRKNLCRRLLSPSDVLPSLPLPLTCARQACEQVLWKALGPLRVDRRLLVQSQDAVAPEAICERQWKIAPSTGRSPQHGRRSARMSTHY